MCNYKVSVYIPTHNRQKLLKRAVESVLSQTYQNIEIIICDDGSSDNTYEYMKLIQNQKNNIVILKNEFPKGAPFSRNRCIEAATGQYITGLDDDDFFDAHRIEKLLNFAIELENSREKHSFIFGDINKITKNGNVQQKAQKSVNLRSILTQNVVGNQILVKKSKLTTIGMFDECLPAWQDYDLWIRLIDKFGKGVGINGSGYNLDQCHPHERISSTNKKVVTAYEMLAKKHKTKKFFVQNRFKLNLFDYGFSDQQISFLFCLKCFFSGCFTRAFRIWKRSSWKRLS